MQRLSTKPPATEELARNWRINEISTATPFYGIRRITAQLRQEGMVIDHKAVAPHMREMGWATIYPGPNLGKRALDWYSRFVTVWEGDRSSPHRLSPQQWRRRWLEVRSSIDGPEQCPTLQQPYVPC